MKTEYKDFIGVFSEAYPEGFCEHLIAEFDRNQKLGAGSDRQTSEGTPKHRKNDYQIGSNGKNINFESFDGKNTIDMFFKGLQHCFEAYANEFSTLKEIKINYSVLRISITIVISLISFYDQKVIALYLQ